MSDALKETQPGSAGNSQPRNECDIQYLGMGMEQVMRRRGRCCVDVRERWKRRSREVDVDQGSRDWQARRANRRFRAPKQATTSNPRR